MACIIYLEDRGSKFLHDIRIYLSQGCIYFQKNLGAAPKLWHEPCSILRITNIWHNCTKRSCQGDLVPGIWAPLTYQTVQCHKKLSLRKRQLYIWDMQCTLQNSSGRWCDLMTVTQKVMTSEMLSSYKGALMIAWGCFKTRDMKLESLLYPAHLVRTYWICGTHVVFCW